MGGRRSRGSPLAGDRWGFDGGGASRYSLTISCWDDWSTAPVALGFGTGTLRR